MGQSRLSSLEKAVLKWKINTVKIAKNLRPSISGIKLPPEVFLLNKLVMLKFIVGNSKAPVSSQHYHNLDK